MKIIEKYKNLNIQLKASIWFLVCSFMQKGISAITVPIFTRIMTKAEYGQYSVFDSWFQIISVIVTLNLCSGVYMQGLVKFDEQGKKYSSSLQGLTLTLVAGWSIIYILFRNFWNDLFSCNSTQMVLMLVLIWTTSIFGFWSTEQRVELKYKSLVIVTIATSLLKPLLSIVLILFLEDNVTARIIGIVSVEFLAYFLLFFRQMKNGKKFFSAQFWKYALCFNLPLIPHYLSNVILNSTDRIMIEKIVGKEQAGIYSVAYSVALIMTLFNTAFNKTIEPWCYKKIKAGESKDIKGIAYVTLIIIALLNFFVIAFAPEIVAIFAPKEYYDAIWIIPPVSMSAYFMFTYVYFAVFSFYYGKTKFVMVATSMGAILNVVLNYVFIKMFGYYAAGYTTLICYMVYSGAHYFFMRKVCNKYESGLKVYEGKKIVAISAIFMVAGFLMLLTYNNIFVRYGIVVAGMIVLFIKRKTMIVWIKQVINLRR